MVTFAEKLRAVIGVMTPYSWAKANELPTQKVGDWIKNNRTPQRAQLIELATKTRIPLDWWLNGDLPPPIPGNGAAPISYETAATAKEMRALVAEEPRSAGLWAFDAVLFSRCRQACVDVHGDEFAGLSLEAQDQYAGDFYNLVCRFAGTLNRQPGDVLKADAVTLAGLLRAMHQTGWARRFPDRRHSAELRQAS